MMFVVTTPHGKVFAVINGTLDTLRQTLSEKLFLSSEHDTFRVFGTTASVLIPDGRRWLPLVFDDFIYIAGTIFEIQNQIDNLTDSEG